MTAGCKVTFAPLLGGSVHQDRRSKRRVGELVKENRRTVWVKLGDGNTIKRHKQNHKVEAA